MATELLRHLTTLLQAAQDQHPAAHPSTPRRALTFTTQIAASGLLQQLPAALRSAQQQLRVLKPQGWCSAACHYCERAMHQAPTMGVTDGETLAVQTTLLKACTELLTSWPGSLGAVGSAAVGPTLIPAAQLALSSLQYVCRQAGELPNDGSSSPHLSLAELGRGALDTCAALTCAADGFSCNWESFTAAAVNSHPQPLRELLVAPNMLSAVVATMNADVYGQFDADSIHAGSEPVVPDFSDVGRLLYMQAPMTPDGNLPVAAWQQLCAREGQLQPGQGLLPPLQQQLLDALGCNSKGFLWLAPVWKARHTHCLYPVAVRVCALIAGIIGHKCSTATSSAAATAGSVPSTVTDTMLRLFLLPPALVLRQLLHEQRVSALGVAAGEDPPEVLYTLTACTTSLQLLVLWWELRRRVANAEAGAVGIGLEWVAAADGVLSSDCLVTPMLHEVLQLLMHLLIGVMQAAQPGSSSGGGGGLCSITASSSTIIGASASGSSNAGTRSQQAEGAPKGSPAAAASVLSGFIARLLPAATQALMGQPSISPTSNTTTSNSSSSRNRNSNPAATWVPLLLRLTAALEQAMRFEAQWGPSQPDLVATKVLGFWGEMAGKFPQGLAWGATYVLLSQQEHTALDHFSYWLETEAGQLLIDQLQDDVCTSHSHQPALLQWLLDNTPPEQLPAAQQRVLGLFCTAAKVCLIAERGRQHVQVNALYDGIFHTAWGVLGRLLPQETVNHGSRTATTQAGDGSSSSSSSQHSRTPDYKAAAAAVAVGQHNPAGGSSSHTDAALPWLPLLGRCFLQASQQMASTIKQCVPDSAASSDSQQQAPRQQQQQQPDDAGRTSLLKLVSIFT